MKKFTFYIITILIIFVVGTIVYTNYGFKKSQSVDLSRVDDHQKAPSVSLLDYKGNTVNSSDYFGKPMVINSWAAWCPFCRKELVDFAALQNEFKDEVVVIAIDRAESLETAKKYSDKLGVSESFIFLLDPGDSFYRSIGGFSMPETIFVDSEGNVRLHKRGPMELNEMREKTRLIL